MKNYSIILIVGAMFLLLSCNSIPLEKHQKLTKLNEKYFATIEFNGKTTCVPIGFKTSNVKMTIDYFFPERWTLPDKTKDEIAYPEFKEPDLIGLTLIISLQYNKTDNTVLLAGKYEYTDYDNYSKHNLFISGTEYKLYENIVTPEIITRKSLFYIIPVILDQKYKVSLLNMTGKTKEFTITVSPGTNK